MRRRVIAFASVLAVLSGCSRNQPRGPQKLLERPTMGGPLPQVATLQIDSGTRGGLVRRTASRVFLPRRALLVFGMAAQGPRRDRPTALRVTVGSDGQTLGELELDSSSGPYRHASVAFDGPGRQGTLEVDLRLTDESGRAVPVPHDWQVAVTDPTLFDRDAIRGVVLVSLDTLRRDHVGLYGYGRSTTPRLDALGREGIVFDDAVSVSSWTLPAHLSMLTSVEPAAHGGIDGHHGFNRAVPTLAQTLRQSGFFTHAVTSHLYVSPEYGLQAGFDRFDYAEGRLATEVADRAIDALDGFGNRPFFLFLHFYDPHWPYAAPPPFAGSFGPGQSPGDATVSRPPAAAAPRDPQPLINDYDAEIRYADTELGRVLDHLRRTGLDRHTLVLVTSDHGEEFADHGGYEHLRTLYEEVIRVPLVVHGPGLRPRREAAGVTLLDIAPTVLDAVGLRSEATHQGRSLLGRLGARDAYGETELGARHGGARTRKLFLRAGASGAKLILSMDRRSGLTLLEEWYDLGQDPAEKASAPPGGNVGADLRDRLVRRWRQAQVYGTAAPGVALTASQVERLRALGYAE